MLDMNLDISALFQALYGPTDLCSLVIECILSWSHVAVGVCVLLTRLKIGVHTREIGVHQESL